MTDTTVTAPDPGRSGSTAFQQADRRSGQQEHPGGRSAAMDRGRAGIREGGTEESRHQRGRAGRQAGRAHAAGTGAAQRRIGRYRRCLVDRADHRHPLSVEHSRLAGASLVERDRDGDADRSQRRGVGLESGRDDDARSARRCQAPQQRTRLLHQRADQGSEVQADARRRRSSQGRVQRGHDGRYREEIKKLHYDEEARPIRRPFRLCAATLPCRFTFSAERFEQRLTLS